MKESRFIELLNLYVDQQLSVEEAAELEVEIARNPARKTTYQQYCRMQKACTLLFEQERSQAPASRTLDASLREANRKIVAFPEARERAPRGYFPVGLLAAAACVAFVFVRFHAPSAPATGSQSSAEVAAVRTAPSPEIAQSVTIPTSGAPNVAKSAANERAGFYSVFASRRASQEAREDVSTRLASDSAVTPVVSYAWMRDVEMEPVQSLSSNRLTLDNTVLGASDERVLQSRKPVQGATEMTAFTFQR